MDSEKVIKAEYRLDGLARIDAIERLQALGYGSHAAEALVDSWDDEVEAGVSP